MTQNYDVIIVGAGPGGNAAAKNAAELGLNALLLERGKTPGCKNMSGSSLFRAPCENAGFTDIMKQEFITSMPQLTGIATTFTVDNDQKQYTSSIEPGRDAFRDFLNVFRPESDKWFAEQAVKSGAKLRTATVYDVIMEKDVCKGVVIDGGERIYAPITIAADGLHSVVARKAGLANFGADKITLAIKYVYKLDPDVLAKRVSAVKDAETGQDVMSWAVTPVLFTDYPMHISVHVLAYPSRGIAVVTCYEHLDGMIENRSNIHQRMKWYLDRPEIKTFLEGGEFIRFNTHCLVFDCPVGYIKKSYKAGLMCVGDAVGAAHPVDGWGANVALWMGKAAAEVAAEAKKKGDYSDAFLAQYEERWRASFVGRDEEIGVNMARMLKTGQMGVIYKAMDGFMGKAIKGKFNDNSYVDLAGMGASEMSSAWSAYPYFMPILAPIIKEGVKKLGKFKKLFEMIE